MTDHDLIETDGYAVFAAERIVVLLWKQPPSRAGLDELRRRFQLARDRRPAQRFGFLTIIEPSATALDLPNEVRGLLSAILKEFQKQISAAAVVVDAEGFRASLIRTFVATMNLANRLDFPSNTEKDLAAAARWLSARDPSLALSPDWIVDSLTQIRSRWKNKPLARR